MKFVSDHDLHIHSGISLCSNDAAQTPERLLRYAKDNGLRQICITDHFWDESVEGASKWYQKQNYEHIAQVLPLPQADGIDFLFGCETELDKHLTLGLSKENMDKFDFIIIPTTHLHMKGFTIERDVTLEERAEAYIKRFDAVLNMDLPFYKIGIAHLTCRLIASENEGDHLKVIDMVSDAEFERLFKKAAELGVGIELNFSLKACAEADRERLLRPYRIAKEQGCKFYFGSDAHFEKNLETCFNRSDVIAEALGLLESDKFVITKRYC
jgi:HisJ family histidinol phosphate phosphatase